NLKLRPLVADKPKYLALSAASAATSPIRQLFESVRDETALTRERAVPKADAGSGDLAKAAAQAAGSKLGSTGSAALSLALKSQQRAGDPRPEVPGAQIEANFKPIQQLVDGDAGTRPVDSLLANLNELYRGLTLAATNPTQAQQ